jgi:hypothetical protein
LLGCYPVQTFGDPIVKDGLKPNPSISNCFIAR